MIKFEKTEVLGWEHAIRGARNPMNSHDRMDSGWTTDGAKKTDIVVDCDYDEFMELVIGKNDLDLMKRLRAAGTDHRKFMRMITVYADITASHTWWAEFDTYKVGVVRNSCSKMHGIHAKEFIFDDFDTEGIEEVGGHTKEMMIALMNHLEWLRQKYNETHEKKYWRAIIEMLPLGFHIKATVMMNYEVLANIYKSRKNHKLDEWSKGFMDWIDNLPLCELIKGE